MKKTHTNTHTHTHTQFSIRWKAIMSRISRKQIRFPGGVGAYYWSIHCKPRGYQVILLVEPRGYQVILLVEPWWYQVILLVEPWWYQVILLVAVTASCHIILPITMSPQCQKSTSAHLLCNGWHTSLVFWSLQWLTYISCLLVFAVQVGLTDTESEKKLSQQLSDICLLL